MPRKSRMFLDGGYYHLIARGNNRMYLFGVKDGFKVFKEYLSESKIKFNWKLSHYCLMSNHVHLLGQIETGKDLPRLMQFLLFGYSRWYREQTKYLGHVWQGRYKSPLIEKESYFLECGRYIERNPGRAKMVDSPEDLAYSSYRVYAYGRKDDLVSLSVAYLGISEDERVRQEVYRNRVEATRPYEEILDKKLMHG